MTMEKIFELERENNELRLQNELSKARIDNTYNHLNLAINIIYSTMKINTIMLMMTSFNNDKEKQ